MNHTGQLCEDDFKVQGHCCAITIPAIKTLDESIDFGHDRAAQDYLQQQYGITPTHHQRLIIPLYALC
jgi:hypothetical protein